MSAAEGIVLALLALGEAGQSPHAAQGGQSLCPAGKDFMDVALVSNVEYNFIPRTVENSVEGEGQLYNSKVGAKVSSGATQSGDEKVPDFLRQSIKGDLVQPLQVVGSGDFFKYSDVVSPPIFILVSLI